MNQGGWGKLKWKNPELQSQDRSELWFEYSKDILGKNYKHYIEMKYKMSSCFLAFINFIACYQLSIIHSLKF